MEAEVREELFALNNLHYEIGRYELGNVLALGN